jgi:hypothetical protein
LPYLVGFLPFHSFGGPNIDFGYLDLAWYGYGELLWEQWLFWIWIFHCI